MKKVLTIFCVIILVLILTGCGEKEKSSREKILDFDRAEITAVILEDYLNNR